MYVGNLEHYQGIDLLLEGFRHTLDRVPEARLVIVGGRQDDIERYTQRCTALGIRPAVFFLGPKPGRPTWPTSCGRPTCWCHPVSRDSIPR